MPTLTAKAKACTEHPHPLILILISTFLSYSPPIYPPLTDVTARWRDIVASNTGTPGYRPQDRCQLQGSVYGRSEVRASFRVASCRVVSRQAMLWMRTRERETQQHTQSQCMLASSTQEEQHSPGIQERNLSQVRSITPPKEGERKMFGLTPMSQRSTAHADEASTSQQGDKGLYDPISLPSPGCLHAYQLQANQSRTHPPPRAISVQVATS